MQEPQALFCRLDRCLAPSRPHPTVGLCLPSLHSSDPWVRGTQDEGRSTRWLLLALEPQLPEARAEESSSWLLGTTSWQSQEAVSQPAGWPFHPEYPGSSVLAGCQQLPLPQEG